MVTRIDLENIISRLVRERRLIEADALYMWAICHHIDAPYCFKLKYRSEDPYVRTLRETGLDKLNCYDATEDTREYVGSVIRQVFELQYPPELYDDVIRRLKDLSHMARRLAFLLYEEGTLVSNGEILFVDSLLSDIFGPAYKILFGEKLSENAIDELISAGLLFRYTSFSRKHGYRHYIVPIYARNVWSSLPELIPLPEVRREREIITVREGYARPIVVRGTGEYAISGISFTGQNLEKLVHIYLLKATDWKVCEKVEEPLHDIHFDVWAIKPDGTYVVFECKGPEYGEVVRMEDIRDFWARMMDLKERSKRNVEAYFVNTGRFTAEQEAYLREKGIIKWEGAEVLKRLIAWGILRLDLIGVPKLSLESGFAINVQKLKEKGLNPEDIFTKEQQ